jgi:hypothetical protein
MGKFATLNFSLVHLSKIFKLISFPRVTCDPKAAATLTTTPSDGCGLGVVDVALLGLSSVIFL